MLIKITREEWIEKFKPDDVFNTYLDADFAIDNPRTAWTLYSTDGYEWISNGVGYTNADGYYRCEIPYNKGDSFEIELKSPD